MRPSRPRIRRACDGQLELFREHALGNFRDLLVAVAKDPAMLVWLDGRTNVRAQPQENFARELMELFTMGVGNYTEDRRLRRRARVHRLEPDRRQAAAPTHARYDFIYNAAQHDTTAKEFTFPIYATAARTIPARSAADGMQDGLDLIDAVRAPSGDRPAAGAQAVRLLRQRGRPAGRGADRRHGAAYYRSGYEIKPMLQPLLRLAAVPRSVELLQALLVAGGVRRPRRSRRSAGPASR